MIQATTFKLSYELTGQGWASCHIQINEQQVTVTASYISDALRDLIRAVLLLKKSGHTPDAIFAEEPGQFRWTLSDHKQGPDSRAHIRLGVYSNEDSVGVRRPRKGERGKKLLDALIPSPLFYQAFVDMLDDVLETYGTKEYEEKWSGGPKSMPFPSREHNELKSLI